MFVLGNSPTSFFGYVRFRKTLTLIIKVFLVGLRRFVVCFVLDWKCSGNRSKMPHFYFQLNASLPRRSSARLSEGLHLGKPEAPKLPVSASPRQRLLRLCIGPHLGEDPLRLG